MTGPWSCPCLGPARGTQSTGQVVESAIGGFALQVIAGRRPHGASAVSGGVARYVGRESGLTSPLSIATGLRTTWAVAPMWHWYGGKGVSANKVRVLSRGA